MVSGPARPEEAVGSERPGKPAVLIVDDDALVLRAFQRTFGGRFDVTTASSGAEALALLARHRVDVAVVDYSMPEMNGVELLRRLAHEHPLVERLIMTAYADLSEVLDLKAVQLVSAVLSKPWDATQVEAAVATALRMASMRRAVEQMRARLAPAGPGERP